MIHKIHTVSESGEWEFRSVAEYHTPNKIDTVVAQQSNDGIDCLWQYGVSQIYIIALHSIKWLKLIHLCRVLENPRKLVRATAISCNALRFEYYLTGSGSRDGQGCSARPNTRITVRQTNSQTHNSPRKTLLPT